MQTALFALSAPLVSTSTMLLVHDDFFKNQPQTQLASWCYLGPP